MQDVPSKTLTQAGLVTELHERGYSDISERMIAEWRRHALLPGFDRKGQGLGRGAGRQPSGWVDAESVINRAAWVSDLLRVYGRFEDAYLPLWMLGYVVPLKRVRKSLKQPVFSLSQALQKEAKDKDLVIEDVIDNVLTNAHRTFGKVSLQLLEPTNPQDIQASLDEMGAAYNLLFNPEYNLEYAPFTGEVANGNTGFGENEALVAGLFEYAPFIQKHLSLGPIKTALRHCTDDDLRVIERDLGIAREIIDHLSRLLKALLSEVPTEFTKGFSDAWHALFTLGRIFVLADVSLRRNGYGDHIDRLLPYVLDSVRAECTESLVAQFKEASAQTALAMQEKMEEWAAKLAANATPTRKGRAA